MRTVLEVSESGNMRQVKTEDTNEEKSLNNIKKILAFSNFSFPDIGVSTALEVKNELE